MFDEDALLNFDRSQIFDWDQKRQDELLAGDHRELYLNHLLIAKNLEAWAARMLEGPMASRGNPVRNKGYVQALDDIAAFLRKGYYVPGGTFSRIDEPEPWRRWEGEQAAFRERDDGPEDSRST